MRQSLLTSLLTSLALTLIIELAAAWVMRIRSVLDLTFVALANCITNPIVNVCFYFALSVFSARSPLPYVMLAGFEIAAVFAEFLYYKITLRYLEGKTPVITGLRRVSKPGLRIYSNAEDMPKVMKGLGVAIISTSKGVMTDREARAQHVGGEVLAYIW